MADTAYQTLYRDEWIAGFERNQPKLRATVTTEAMIKGQSAVFLVAQSNREAVTRGSNGLIPAAVDDLTQNTCQLSEKHDLSQKTGFNIFAGQSDQRAIMQALTRKVINRDIDDVIIDELANATVSANTTASIMTKALVNTAKTKLGNSDVPTDDGNLFAAVTPAAWAHLTDIPEFTSKDYVPQGVMVEGSVEMYKWLGIVWMEHTGLPGKGTSGAKCFIWHKNAIGHAHNVSDIQSLVGYHEEQDYSWARTSLYHGAKLLQNTGVVVINHDDTVYS